MSLRDPRVVTIGALVAATVACLVFLLPRPHASGGPPAPSPSESIERPSASAAVGGLSVRRFAGDPLPNPPAAPTAHDGQAKLWETGGRWWAAMVDPASGAYHVFELAGDKRGWADTGVLIDDRPAVHPDVLLSGGKLYTLSSGSSRSAAARPELRRFSVDPATGWKLDRGFPVAVAGFGVSSPSIARDANGRVWVAFVDQGRVMINASGADEATWADPWRLPGPGTVSHLEDVARVIAVGSDRVGVMWSNQADGAIRFASHPTAADPADPKSWTTEVALEGAHMADNHIGLATAPIDGAQRVVAVVKTSRDIATDADRNDPEVLVLAQRPGGGGWRQSLVGRVRDSQTRPSILVDPTRNAVVVVTTVTGPSGSWIAYQLAGLDDLAFSPGSDLKLIGDEDDVVVDATSTHQPVDLGAGAVILAWDQERGRYEHAVLATGG